MPIPKYFKNRFLEQVGRSGRNIKHMFKDIKAAGAWDPGKDREPKATLRQVPGNSPGRAEARSPAVC